METDPLWRIFVGGYGRVMGAVDAEHGGADAGGGDEVVAGEVGDEVGVCEAAASPGHFFFIFFCFSVLFFCSSFYLMGMREVPKVPGKVGMRWRGWFWMELWGDEGGVEQSRNCGDVVST